VSTTSTMERIEGMTTQPVTNLHDIRRFLSTYGQGPQPWASSEEALDKLYRILLKHEADDGFWRNLAGLVRRLEDRGVRPAILAGSDVVGREAGDALVQALRAALGRAGVRPGGRAAFARSCRTATPLAGFMLLGLAVACKEDKASDEQCAEAEELGLSEDDGQIYCELVDMIDAADLSDTQREDLMECLPDMSAAEWEELLSDWSEMSDSDVEDEMQTLSWTDCTERDSSGLH
jgi:hypothetical protein